MEVEEFKECRKYFKDAVSENQFTPPPFLHPDFNFDVNIQADATILKKYNLKLNKASLKYKLNDVENMIDDVVNLQFYPVCKTE